MSAMNETLQTMLTRRSVKNYKPDPVPDELLDQILTAGTWAASGKNVQAAKMVLLTDPGMIARLERLNAAVLGAPGTHPFYGAPAVVVVFADRRMFTYVEDGSLVLGNLMLAAHSLGVDSCWVHRAREEFASPEGHALMAEWGVPDSYDGIGHCLLGYGAGEYPAMRPRKPDYILKV